MFSKDIINENAEGLAKKPGSDRSWIWMPVLLLIFGLAAILLVYLTNIIRHSQHRNELLMSSLMKIETETSLFHLFLEKYLNGDEGLEPKHIFLHIEEAIHISESVLNGDDAQYGRISDPEDRNTVESLRVRVAKLKAMGLDRLNGRDPSGSPRLNVHKFDKYFNKTLYLNRAVVSKLRAGNASYAKKADSFFGIILVVLAGIILFTIAVFMRIRQRQREVTDEIRESEQEFRMLFNSLSNAIFLCSDDNILDCNPRALELFGVSENSELLNKSLLDFSPKEQDDEMDSRILFFDYITKASKEGNANFEFKFHRPDGSDFYADVSLTAIKIRGRALLQAVVRDITERKKMLVDLERLATTDTLTKAFNRTKFNELIVMEIERAKRFHHALSMLMFDLDHFKDVNDTYGHTVGDEVLRMTADIVRHHMRRTNHFIRWGGEEFIVIAIEADLDDSVRLAERIRGEIESSKFETVKTVTLSFGVTQLKANDSVASFIKRVDDALYKAKENGRNRVEFL